MKDYYSDYGHNFVKIFKNFDLPDFVKEADIISEERLASMPDEAFANKIARKLPISSAADTYISTAYHLSCNDKDENVDASLNKAASFWGIQEEVEKLKSTLSSMDKSASAEEESTKWEICHSTPSGGCMMIKAEGSDSETLKKAYDGFMKSASVFPFASRTIIAKQFATEFDKMGMEIPFELGAMSERNFPNATEVAQQIKSRAIRIDDYSKKAELIKIADSLLESEDRDIEGYSKLAEMLDEIDTQNELSRFYGNPLKNAHESVFNTSREEAIKACGTLKLASGEYSIEDLKGVHSDIFKLALTEDDYNMVTHKVAIGGINASDTVNVPIPTAAPKTKDVYKAKEVADKTQEDGAIANPSVENRLAPTSINNPQIRTKVAIDFSLLPFISDESKKNLVEYL